MEENWVKIYISQDYFKSEMVKQVLIDNSIDAVIIDKQGFPYKIGETEVYIHKDNFNHALEIIVKNDL